MRLNRIYNVCDIFKTHLNTKTSSLLQSPDSIISLHVSSPLTWIFFPVSFGCQCSCFPLKFNFYDIYSSITSTDPGGRKTDSVWRIRIPQTEQSSFAACNSLRFFQVLVRSINSKPQLKNVSLPSEFDSSRHSKQMPSFHELNKGPKRLLLEENNELSAAWNMASFCWKNKRWCW